MEVNVDWQQINKIWSYTTVEYEYLTMTLQQVTFKDHFLDIVEGTVVFNVVLDFDDDVISVVFNNEGVLSPKHYVGVLDCGIWSS